MSLMSSPCDPAPLLEQAVRLGIDRVGVARACEVPQEVSDGYARWLADGCNASMDYLDRYHDVRRDPRLLLDGARSVISCAIGYYHTSRQLQGAPAIASYAHGDDYHDVVRRLLEPLAAYVRETYGGETRICVDTAPIHERYWAVAAGVGYRGRSGLVIVPGLGTYCFLAEVIATAEIGETPRREVTACDGCDRCVKACPGGAIGRDGVVDARRCLSYLTIEHRGELPGQLSTGNRLYGCDTCQQVCPCNRDIAACGHPEFELRPAYRDITRESLAALTPESYAALFRHSAIKRAKLAGILRNLNHL